MNYRTKKILETIGSILGFIIISPIWIPAFLFIGLPFIVWLDWNSGSILPNFKSREDWFKFNSGEFWFNIIWALAKIWTIAITIVYLILLSPLLLLTGIITLVSKLFGIKERTPQEKHKDELEEYLENRRNSINQEGLQKKKQKLLQRYSED